MNKLIVRYITLSIVIFCNSLNLNAQIIDFSKENPYQKVFVDTDNFGASYLDTLQNSYTKIIVDTIQFSMLNDLAYYWHTRNLNTALDFTKKGLEISANKENELWHGRFKITQGAILLRMEKLDSALIVLEEAKKLVNEEDMAFINTQLGYVFERRGELSKAAAYAFESLKLGEELNNKKAIALAYSDLSNLFWKQSKFEKGLEYGLQSLKIFEQRGLNDLDYDFTLYVVGNNYLGLKKYQEAVKFYEHAIIIAGRYGFYNNASDIYISLVDLYTFLNQFEKANAAGLNATKFAELLDNNFMLMRSWLSVGKSQVLQGKYISAIESLKKSITIATKDFGDEYYLSQAYEGLGKAYAGTHNYKDAYLAFAEYDKLKNEIFTADSDQRISLLQTEMNVADKVSTIQNQETQLKKQKNTQTLITSIASLLLLLLLLLFITFYNNRKKSRLLTKQNIEKEFLLKEIHHRVKNNLGIVSSLLELQADKIKDTNVKLAMQESQNRVYSISMIHQKLYQGENISSIEMKDYFKNLGSHILDSFAAKDRVKIKCPMKSIELDVDTAIPLGLIVNELFTNSLKHAFPKNIKGEISIILDRSDEYNYKLEVKDNGVGQNKEIKYKDFGFGIQLIELLVDQLGGKMQKYTENGFYVTIDFKVG